MIVYRDGEKQYIDRGLYIVFVFVFVFLLFSPREIEQIVKDFLF